MFQGITPNYCGLAWTICMGSVVQASGLGRIVKAGSVVVLDPQTGERMYMERLNDCHPPLKPKYEQAAHKLDLDAMDLAQLSWETGLTSHQLRHEAPHLYRPVLAKSGAAVIENKLVVAVALHPTHLAECLAWNMLNWCIALCHEQAIAESMVSAPTS
jgi:hypothetical protein